MCRYTTPIYLINLLWKLGLGLWLDLHLHYFRIFAAFHIAEISTKVMGLLIGPLSMSEDGFRQPWRMTHNVHIYRSGISPGNGPIS